MAIFDYNADLGAAFAAELGADNARFFECDVRNTESIAAGVKELAVWVETTAKPLGGIIPAAGVGLPGLVLLLLYSSYYSYQHTNQSDRQPP